MSGPLARVEVRVSGRVQGVFYRTGAKEIANSLSVKGWVKNTNDGCVNLVAEGPKPLLEEFIAWCKKGTSQAKVKNVEIKWSEPLGEFSNFEVRYYS